MLLVGRLVLHANTQKRSITSLTVNFRPVTQVRGKKISGFTGFSNQRARQQKVAQNKRNSRRVNKISFFKKKKNHSAIHPSPSHHIASQVAAVRYDGPGALDKSPARRLRIPSLPHRESSIEDYFTPPHPPAPPPCHC